MFQGIYDLYAATGEAKSAQITFDDGVDNGKLRPTLILTFH